MLQISLNLLICFVIVTQATNVNLTTTNTAAATNSTIAAIQKGIDNVQKPLGTVISDSGVTTQNANKSAATVNVIEKPNTKSGVTVGVASNSSNSNSSIQPNDVAKDAKRKDGEEVHTRKVTKTEHIPSAAVEPQAPTIATNNTKVPTVVEKAAAAAATLPAVHPAVPPVVPAPQQSPLPSQSASSSPPQIPKAEPQKPSLPHPVVIAAKNDTVPIKSATQSPTSTTTGTPKKPLITYSVDDDPDMRAIRDKISKSSKQSHGSVAEANGALNEPVVLQSSELLEDDYKERDYIIPIIGLIFAVPLLLILANFLSRKVRQYWSKRNYQRMDYLINEMYN